MNQLELFPEEYDPKKEIQVLRVEWEKTRKALFAKHDELVKKYNKLAHDYAVLKLSVGIRTDIV